MKRVCATCQYFREGTWCSNSQSPHFRNGTVQPGDTCQAYTQRGQKAPLALRLFNQALARRLKKH